MNRRKNEMEEKNNHPTAENCIQEAKSLLEQGNRVGAVAMLSQAIALNDDAVDAYFLRGELLLAMGDKKGAEQDMRRVLELDPERVAHITGDYQL